MGDLAEIAARFQELLGGENAIESNFHRSFHAGFLFFSFDFGDARFLFEDTATLGEFARGDDGLFDKEPLFAAVDGTAADFVAGVADRGIGIEACLLRAGFGGANFGFGLAKSGIGGGGETFRVVEGEEFFVRLFLGATHAGERQVQGVACRRVDAWAFAFDRGGARGRLLGRGWQNSSMVAKERSVSSFDFSCICGSFGFVLFCVYVLVCFGWLVSAVKAAASRRTPKAYVDLVLC